jgi:hypothetical protein
MCISQKQLVFPIKHAILIEVSFSSFHLNMQFSKKYLLVVVIKVHISQKQLAFSCFHLNVQFAKSIV